MCSAGPFLPSDICLAETGLLQCVCDVGGLVSEACVAGTTPGLVMRSGMLVCSFGMKWMYIFSYCII